MRANPQHHNMPIKLAALALFTALITATTALAAGPNPPAQTHPEDAQFIPADFPRDHSFGQHVSLDNGRFCVGASYFDGGRSFGRVLSYKLADLNDSFELFIDDMESTHTIGSFSVIKDGIIATPVVGLAGDDNARSVYLYDANDGTLLHKIRPDDTIPDHYFAGHIALNDGLLAVGAARDDDNGYASGSVYIYDVHTGDLLHKLTADDGMPDDFFGASIALHNGQLAVGAPGDDTLAQSSGAIYLFDTTTWQQLHKFLADNGQAHDSLGRLVTMDDGMIADGASLDQDNGLFAGAVYLFDTITGDQIAKIYPEDPHERDQFGSAVAISQGIIAVGARHYDFKGRLKVGTVYLFDASTGSQLAQLLPSNYSTSKSFGKSLAFEGPDLIVGSIGPVYFYNISTIVCPADLTADRVLDFFDISAFLDAFANQDPAADFTNDSAFDFFDVSAFLDHFATACPE